MDTPEERDDTPESADDETPAVEEMRPGWMTEYEERFDRLEDIAATTADLTQQILSQLPVTPSQETREAAAEVREAQRELEAASDEKPKADEKQPDEPAPPKRRSIFSKGRKKAE